MSRLDAIRKLNQKNKAEANKPSGMSNEKCDLCEGCPFADEGFPKLSAHNEGGDSGILVVTPPPIRAQYPDKPISGNAANIMNKACTAVGEDIKDYTYYPSMRCIYNSDRVPTKITTAARKHCAQYMNRFVKKFDPDLIITLGVEAISSLRGKAMKISKVRGVVQEDIVKGKPVLPFLNPSAVAARPENAPTFKSDVALLRRFIDADYDAKAMRASQDLGTVHVVKDLDFLMKLKPELLSFDLECIGTRWYVPEARILTMQFSYDRENSYVLPWDHPDDPRSMREKRKLKAQLKKILEQKDTYVFGQNNKFDAVWMLTHLGIDYRIAEDTQMIAAILDENSPKNQDDLVRRYVPEMAGYSDLFNATVRDKGRLDLEPLENVIEYGGQDTISNFRLLDNIYPLIEKDEGLMRHYRYASMPGLNMFKYVDAQGMGVDMENFHEFGEMVTQRAKEQRTGLMSQVDRSILRAHHNKGADGKTGCTFSRSAFTRDILFDHPKGFKLKPKVFTKSTKKLPEHLQVPSTSGKDHLPFFFEDCPFTVDLAQYLKTNKMLTGNVESFEKKFIVNGMVYPSYFLHVTDTGRTNSRDPNGQNIPKRSDLAKAYRKSFIAPKGYYIVEADLSQAELRFSAEAANEMNMIQIYKDGGDIHRATGIIVANMTEAQFDKLPKKQQKDYRQKAKAVNFGFIYGMGWKSFIVYAKTDYGVEFSEEEAKRIRNSFFTKYPALAKWHEDVRKVIHRDGEVRSMTGRIRHLPQVYSSDDGIASAAERQGINSPIQETSSTMGVISMSRLRNEVDPDLIRPFAFVHDAIFALVKKEYLDWGCRTLKYYMESNPISEMFDMNLRLPIVADVAFGPDLGNQIELEGMELDKPFDFTAGDVGEEIAEMGIVLPEQKIPPNNGRVKQPEHLWNLAA